MYMYLNGDGIGRGSHIAICFPLERSVRRYLTLAIQTEGHRDVAGPEQQITTGIYNRLATRSMEMEWEEEHKSQSSLSS